VLFRSVQWYNVMLKVSFHQTAGSMVYVIVHVVVSPDSRINRVHYRTGGRVT
jgi:hypothetical protein